jgi:glucose/arabinose dehydrogenase
MRRTATASVLTLLAATIVLGVASPAPAPVLPAAFQLVDYPTGQAPNNLTDYAWLENGALITTGKDGTITVAPPGGPPRVVTKVPGVRARGDHGMLGFALANDYPTTGHVYLSYDQGSVTGTGFGMVEEWTASPPADPTSFTRTRSVLDGSLTSPQLAMTSPNHGIDSVVVAPDDTLFVTIGDDTPPTGLPDSMRAQDTSLPYGKVLHLTPDGRGVASNPFYSAATPTSWRSMIHSYGFRNPFRLALDPRSGVPYVGDVGWSTSEEINALVPGTNGGWPCYEGTGQTTYSSYPVCQSLYAAGSAQLPLWAYQHAGAGASITAGMFYTGSTYPTAYRDSLFFGDYVRGQLWTMATDASAHLTRVPEAAGLAGDVGGPVAFHPGPNGDVTYADILTGNVRRLVYGAGNRPPVAAFTTSADPTTRTVSFSSGDSYDLDGDELSFSWDFGDGQSAQGATAVHTYGTDDAVQVTLTVTDQLGATDVHTAPVHPANHTPDLAIDTPSGTFAVGDAVALTAEATDAEDGGLAVHWETVLLHCPFAGSCHRHPEGSLETGPSYSHEFTDHGADTTMLVTASVQDSEGAVASRTFEARPTLRTVAVNSPVPVTINGETAASAIVVAGSVVQLNAPTTSSYWRFRSWDDGGAAAHSITMPDADRTLNASYVTAIAQRYSALGGSASVLGNPTSTEYDVAGGRARNYSGGRLYWSAATGAHWVRTDILTKYLAGGGPAASGFPTTDGIAVTGGRAAYFTGARIYWTSSYGAHTVKGPVLTKYLAAGGPGGYGMPTTDVVSVTGGSYTHFTGGRSIFWSTPTKAHLVYGPIRTRYAALGYQTSCLRFPTSDRLTTATGYRTNFTGGYITYNTSTKQTVNRC